MFHVYLYHCNILSVDHLLGKGLPFGSLGRDVFLYFCHITICYMTTMRLHSTIRFSIDDNVNILTPCSKTLYKKFTKLASF